MSASEVNQLLGAVVHNIRKRQSSKRGILLTTKRLMDHDVMKPSGTPQKAHGPEHQCQNLLSEMSAALAPATRMDSGVQNTTF
jgi:hypothetical protein